jgi:hypothetical protein
MIPPQHSVVLYFRATLLQTKRRPGSADCDARRTPNSFHLLLIHQWKYDDFPQTASTRERGNSYEWLRSEAELWGGSWTALLTAGNSNATTSAEGISK